MLCTDEDSEVDQLAGRWIDPGATNGTLAFLQYTSGSTATPKGVMITHGNLLDNSARIQASFDSTPESRGVFWLPLFHDMGLIGGVIQTVYCGGSSTLFSPVSFLQRPLRWLQAISRTGATISGGPDFAYDLCVEKTTPEQRAGLDLSRWRVALNGAEPVRPETLDRFALAFAPAGFRREAFLPCYGLAEATLLVSGNPSGNPPVVLSLDADALGRGKVALSTQRGQGRRLASSGRVAAGHRVVVVDPATRVPCAYDRIGEIWVSGPSVASGYWGQPRETEELLCATLSLGEGPFLRTGDLGFLHDGELFVTGRLKDMIIVRGRNVYPQDIEWTAERCHPALRAGGTAAFAVEIHGEERLVVVQETERNRDPGLAEEVIAAIRLAVAEQHDIEVFAIRLIRMLSLPKTSSGKVQRHKCREGFLAGSLDVIAEWTWQHVPTPALTLASDAIIERSAMIDGSGSPKRDAIATWLAAKVAGPLGIRPDEVDVSRPLAGFGIGSLQAVRLAAELEEWLGRKLTPTLVYDYPTIDTLADFLGGEMRPRGDRQGSANRCCQEREPIAIIGIGCRFPGAAHPAAFWRMLRDGVEGVGPIPGSRWEPGALERRASPERGGFLPDIVSNQFDADFFGISPREAVYIDPQHRLLLELAWEALEDGGQAPERWAGAAVGVFIGIATNDYAQLQAKRGGRERRLSNHWLCRQHRRQPDLAPIRLPRTEPRDRHRLLILARGSQSRVPQLVGWRIRTCHGGRGEDLILMPEVLASFAKAGIPCTADGRCKTFDARANGYVRG